MNLYSLSGVVKGLVAGDSQTPLGDTEGASVGALLAAGPTTPVKPDDRPESTQSFVPRLGSARNDLPRNSRGALHGGALTMMAALAAQQACPAEPVTTCSRSRRDCGVIPVRAALTNLGFWHFAVSAGTGSSYVPVRADAWAGTRRRRPPRLHLSAAYDGHQSGGMVTRREGTQMAGRPRQDNSQVQGAAASLLNGLAVLEAFSVQSPVLGVTEVAQRVGLHKSTVSRILGGLTEAGYVQRDEETGRYRLGLGLLGPDDRGPRS